MGVVIETLSLGQLEAEQGKAATRVLEASRSLTRAAMRWYDIGGQPQVDGLRRAVERLRAETRTYRALGRRIARRSRAA